MEQAAVNIILVDFYGILIEAVPDFGINGKAKVALIS
jgi:hypothetical protein